MIKLSDYVINFIEKIGVKDVFTLVGGGSMHLVDSLGKNKNVNYVCCLHEQACAIAAESYSQCTNNIGVVIVTSGPGATNALTGVAGGWLDSTPMLIISGQVKKDDLAINKGVRQMGFQEVDIVSMVKPITKYSVTIIDPYSIKYHLEKAVYLAKNGRPGPVWIDIPLDIQAAELDENKLVIGYSSTYSHYSIPDDVIYETLNLINKSKRPVIIAGNGIRLSNSLDKFLELIEKLNIPVLTTWKAIDFIYEDHPLFVGRPGVVGQRAANFIQQNSDLLISIGARLDYGQTAYNHKNFAPNAKKILVDIDEKELDKLEDMLNISLSIPRNANIFITKLLEKSDNFINLKNRNNWITKCKMWNRQYPVILKEYWDEKDYVNDYVLIDVLSKEMTSKDLFIPGSSGACSERTMQAFKVKEGMRIFNTEGLGSMGFGIPAAIGGCIASGKKNTICIEGDGGFAMNIQELETVRRLNLPIKFFVLNNKGYGSIKTTQNNYFEGNLVGCDEGSGLSLPNCRAMAKAMGIQTRLLRDHHNIKNNIKEILNYPGPIVCEVMSNPNQVTSPRVSSKKMPDGSMISLPMEDMWPFLDREEFMANILTSN